MHDEAEAACGRAVRIAEELHSESPDLPKYRQLLCRVYYNRGAAFAESQRFDDAISDYSQAIQVDSRFARAFHNRGSAYAEKGDLDKAVDDYTKALRLGPGVYYAYHARGRMYLKKRQFAQAIEDFTDALEHAPTGDDLYAVLPRGQLHSDAAWLLATCPDARLRDPGRAVRLAADAVKLRTYWRQTLGVSRYRAGDFKGSIEVLEKSTKDACSWSFLAMAHWQLDDTAEARRWYDQAVERLANLAKPPDARDAKRRLSSEEKLGPEPFRRFVVEAAELLGIDDAQAQSDPSTDKQPEEFADHMIFPWSAWQDPLW
jgi:tetratricopeptide (TPR) repeat protein